MGDAIKIAAKTALIAVITAAIVALFVNIQVPSLDYSVFTNALSVGLAVCYHYFPVTQVLFPIVLVVFSFDLAYKGFQLAMIAVRWVMKVNE